MRVLLSLLFLVVAFLAAGAAAQTPCQGGTATAPACSRDWSSAPLVVQMCPLTATTEAGVRLVVRETNNTPLLSVTGTAGTNVSLPVSSAPLASASAPTRVLKFACEDALARVGADTFVSVTFPVRSAPAAPLLP